jgi:hypothetical protein
VVFSGIGAEDIDLSRAAGAGVAALKVFLAQAAAQEGAAAGAAARSAAGAFQSVLARTLDEAGAEAVPRHGSSGLFLDIAARRDGEFVLGVEADGADWAGLTACRDRERGRPSALTGMGWRLHRTWSLGWLAQPEAERARLRAALDPGAAAPAAPAPAAVDGPDPGLAAPYHEAAVEIPKGAPLTEVPFATLGKLLAEVVRQEAPVHQEAVLERARILWGLPSPLPAAERAALLQGLRLARSLHGLVESGGIWRAAESPPAVPRDRRATAPHLRRAALVPPEEVEAAARALLGARFQATEQELARGITRLLGLEPGAEAAMAARIAALVGAGRISPAAG